MGLVSIIVARLSRYLNSSFHQRTGPSGARKWMGDYGENVAADWLRVQNCRILAKNFKGPRGGEVDIVAKKGKQLLFVEVKTRKHNTKIRGLAAVNRKKQDLIRRGGNEWLKRLGTRDVLWRYDVIEVEVTEGKRPEVTHIENAFQARPNRRRI